MDKQEMLLMAVEEVLKKEHLRDEEMVEVDFEVN